MKKIMNGKLYDTDKAELIYEYRVQDKITKYFKTLNGNYFKIIKTLRSDIIKKCPNDVIESIIKPSFYADNLDYFTKKFIESDMELTTKEEVQRDVENHLSIEDYIKIFGEVEDA